MITSTAQAQEEVLRTLATKRRFWSAGDIARNMMGRKMLTNDPSAYALVNDVLRDLLGKGLVFKAGNGKRVQWWLARPEQAVAHLVAK